VCREANIHCRLSHPNIVELLGYVKCFKYVGIVMEYVDGGNLDDFLSEKDQTFPTWNCRFKIVYEIASALSFIHNYKAEKVFCHGDLKPLNVLLTCERQVKLADFGSAAFLKATGASSTTLDVDNTKEHSIIYASPELLENIGMEKTTAMDIYRWGYYEIFSYFVE